MIKISGYKQVEYKEFINSLRCHFEAQDKTVIELANEIESSPQTVRNALFGYQQQLSDKKLTDVLKSVKMDGIILWVNGKKYFYGK